MLEAQKLLPLRLQSRLLLSQKHLNLIRRLFNELLFGQQANFFELNAAVLTEEVGEVARIIARRYGEQNEKASDKDMDLGEELSDVLFVILCLANQTGTDLQEEWNARMARKTVRDGERFMNDPGLR